MSVACAGKEGSSIWLARATQRRKQPSNFLPLMELYLVIGEMEFVLLDLLGEETSVAGLPKTQMNLGHKKNQLEQAIRYFPDYMSIPTHHLCIIRISFGMIRPGLTIIHITRQIGVEYGPKPVCFFYFLFFIFYFFGFGRRAEMASRPVSVGIVHSPPLQPLGSRTIQLSFTPCLFGLQSRHALKLWLYNPIPSLPP